MSIEFRGTDALIGALKEKANLDDVKNVVRMNGAEMHRNTHRNAPVDTGFMKRHVQLEKRDDGMTARVYSAAEYSAYVEYGTRFMDAQPFVRPAYQKQKSIFLKDMKRLMK